MRITFLGAARMVTGSSFLLEHNGFSLLIDLGLAQGNDEERTGSELPFSAQDIDAVILTHAHIDHSGRLPLLAKEGYSGPVYATEATYRLSSIMLLDSAHIQESDAFWKSRRSMREGGASVEPLYTAEDAEAALGLFQSVPYCQRIFLRDDISFMMIDAGHLLGSASVKIFYSEDGEERSIVFSGDIGNTDQPMLRNPEYFDTADYAVMESTYGDRLHEKPEGTEKDVLRKRAEELAEITDRTFRRGGNLIIPSFAVGRTQEILYLFRIIMENRILPYEIPVFVDSPLSVRATAVFASCLRDDYFDDEAREMIAKGVNPILFPSLTAVIDSDESKKLNQRKESAVIISSSGMCEAGRIRHHLKHNLWRPECTVLFVGYQVPGTLGAHLLGGAKEVKLFGETVKVAARIENLPGISGHGDKNELTCWIGALKRPPKKIFVVHGEDGVCDSFAAHLAETFGYDTTAPYSGDVYDLLTGERIREGSRELRRKAKPAGKASSNVMARLLAAVDRLAKVAREAEGMPNKDLAKFADQISALADKWARRKD